MKSPTLNPYPRKRVFALPSHSEPGALQQFQSEADINEIMRRNVPLTQPNEPPLYADLTKITDYQSHLNSVIRVQNSFDALPSKVRQTFDNDPSRLMSFISDPANLQRAQALGLIPTPSASKSAPVQGAPAGTEPAKSQTQTVQTSEQS